MGTASSGKAGIGVLLKVGTGVSPEVFLTVANATQVSAGGVTLNMIDATHLDSPDFYQEFIPGLKSADEVTFTLQWNPAIASHVELKDILEERALRTFQIDTGGIGMTKSLECDAYVSQLGNIEISPEAIMTQSCTLRPSGAWRLINN